MVSHLQLIIRHPFKFLRSIYETCARLLLIFLQHILLPNECKAVVFRTEIARCFLGSFLANFWDLVYKAPYGARSDQYSLLDLGGVQTIIVPPDAGPRFQAKSTSLVMLYAHGGGFMFGESLMWLSSYERWVKAAKAQNLDLIVVAVEYRLSKNYKFPACRDDFLAVYRSLINEHSILPENIVFCGDSAGGGLVAMAALHARNTGILLPKGLILISPWLDLTLEKTLKSPALATDFLVSFSKANPELVTTLLPPYLLPNDPLVSPISQELHKLPPQLVFAGTAEVLLPDSSAWVTRSRKAGNKVDFILGEGEMHTYAMGWPFCSTSVERTTDQILVEYLHRLSKLGNDKKKEN